MDVNEVYLDNSATTQVCAPAAQAVMEMMTTAYGNPSSLHRKGIEAEQKVAQARESVASLLGVPARELFFTSGGTEANNLALLGAAAAGKRRGKRIVTTVLEHASVYDTAAFLESEGFDVVFLEPGPDGNISPAAIAEAITPNTILVSMMLVNNETGTILPVKAAAAAIKRCGAPALLHCDAVQAFGKLPVKPKTLGADLVTVSSHKIHGPKGVGALYIRKGARIIPQTHGGEQEGGVRPGTEAAPLIAGFGAAVDAIGDLKAHEAHAKELKEYLFKGLSALPDIVVHSPKDASPYVVSFSVPGIRSETMLHHLASRGVYVSSGSACSKGKVSRVLSALCPDRRLVDSVLRVSFCRDNTIEDIDALLDGIQDGMRVLQHVK